MGCSVCVRYGGQFLCLLSPTMEPLYILQFVPCYWKWVYSKSIQYRYVGFPANSHILVKYSYARGTCLAAEFLKNSKIPHHCFPFPSTSMQSINMFKLNSFVSVHVKQDVFSNSKEGHCGLYQAPQDYIFKKLLITNKKLLITLQ